METFANSGQQKDAEASVESFREGLGPFVVAAERTRMPMIFTNAKAPGYPIIFANAAFLGLTGYDRGEVLGQEFRSLLAEDREAVAMATADAAFNEDDGTEGDILYRRKDGSEFWASTFASPVRDESGAVVQHFASLVDLTRNNQNNARGRLINQLTQGLHSSRDALNSAGVELEISVERRVEERRSSLKLLNAVIDGFPDAVMLLEVDGNEHRFAYINRAAEKFIRRPRDELIGRLDEGLVSAEYSLENRNVMASNTASHVKDRVLETDAGDRNVEVRKVPFKGSAGSPDGLLVIIRDLTEMRDLEDSLRQRNRIDALGQLTGGIAHDFNNILAIAIGNLDLLDSHDNSAAERKEILEDARNACLRGAELTGRLLAFARRQALDPVSINVNELLSEYAKLLSRLLGANIDLQFKLAEGLWHAVVDPAQLEAALTNLVTNARDAMPDGGRLTISTRNEVLGPSYTCKHPGLEPGEYIAIEVSDSGSGMTPEIQKKAIEPFFTTKAPGHGTGLGLSMVFGFAEQSEGHVHFYSEREEGTTVVLFFPRAARTAAEKEVKDSRLIEAARGETVLVVDDNASLRRVTSKQLSSFGYKVLEAADGRSALRLLRKEGAVDLLLTDIFMPGGLSGVELGREARQLRPDLKLVYMSGFPETISGERADLDPDVVLLRKPFRNTELSRRIREVLGSGQDA